MAEIGIRPGTESDVPEILTVLAKSLGENALLQRTTELFEWKHIHNPFGRSLLLVATSGSRIVGVRAFMRWSLATRDGGQLSCVRAVDTATLPEFQGQGIFRSLTLAAVEMARDEGVDLIFNTPNEKSAPGYLKMGWGEVGWLPPLVRPRPGRSIHPDETGMVSLDAVVPDAGQVPPWTPSDRPPAGLRTIRSEPYFHWRFRSHPTARYGWVGDARGGLIVRASVRSGRSELLVSELLHGYSGMGSLARRHRARYLAAFFTRHSPEEAFAHRAGMFRVPGVKGLRLVANPLSRLDIDVFDLASWDLSLGDVELL